MTRIINIFRHNALQKIIALVAAFLMWIFVMNEQDPPIEGNYTVPITISNLPYSLIPVYEEKTIQVDVRAPRSNFVKYDANAFRAYANLDGMSEGNYRITPQIVMPQGFELIETTPATIDISLDPLIEKQMSIDIVTSGNIAPDAAIKGIRKSMDVVTVVGPKSFVEQAVKVLGTLNLNSNSSSFDTQVTMNALDANQNIIPRVKVVPSVITVSVDVESGLKKRIVPIIPELHVADGWELTNITTNPAQVEIVGAESVVNTIVTLKTEPFTVQTGQRLFHGTLKLEVPDGVTVKEDAVTVNASVIRKPVMRETN